MLKTKAKKELTDMDKKLLKYYFACLISELSKVFIFLLIFIYLKLFKEYLFALLFLMILRNNGGGLHFNNYISCLLVSFLFLYSSIHLTIYISLPQYIIQISILVCALIGYILVPITSNNRPSATLTQIKKSKRNTLFIIVSFFILVCICPNNIPILIGYWTIILHIEQLIIAYFIREVKKHVRLGRQI